MESLSLILAFLNQMLYNHSLMLIALKILWFSHFNVNLKLMSNTKLTKSRNIVRFN